jgi:hypothetical protein
MPSGDTAALTNQCTCPMIWNSYSRPGIDWESLIINAVRFLRREVLNEDCYSYSNSKNSNWNNNKNGPWSGFRRLQIIQLYIMYSSSSCRTGSSDFFSFWLNLRLWVSQTGGRAPWTGDQPAERPLNAENKIYADSHPFLEWHITRFYSCLLFLNDSLKSQFFDRSLWSPLCSSGTTDLEVRVWFPALPDFLRRSGSVTGSTQPREYNWGATWKKK